MDELDVLLLWLFWSLLPHMVSSEPTMHLLLEELDQHHLVLHSTNLEILRGSYDTTDGREEKTIVDELIFITRNLIAKPCVYRFYHYTIHEVW